MLGCRMLRKYLRIVGMISPLPNSEPIDILQLLAPWANSMFIDFENILRFFSLLLKPTDRTFLISSSYTILSKFSLKRAALLKNHHQSADLLNNRFQSIYRKASDQSSKYMVFDLVALYYQILKLFQRQI